MGTRSVWRYPNVYTGANYTILPDTTVNNTHWVLSVRCSGCTKWSAKTINPSSTAEFLALAMNHSPGSVKTPSDPGSTFTMHDVTGRISFNFNNAKQANFQAATKPLRMARREFVGPKPRPR